MKKAAAGATGCGVKKSCRIKVMRPLKSRSRRVSPSARIACETSCTMKFKWEKLRAREMEI